MSQEKLTVAELKAAMKTPDYQSPGGEVAATFPLDGLRIPRRDASVAHAQFAVCPFTIVIDTREQLPYSFNGMACDGSQPLVVPTVSKGLATGDYSIEGLEETLTVERKTAEDLVGSVCGGHARFEREHQRMLGMVEVGGHVALVCEGNYAAMDDQLKADGRDAAAATLLGTMVSWPCKYRCPWYFAGDRRRSEILTFRLLWKWFWLAKKQRD